MKKSIVIRCITKKSKGFGNLNRCLILANSLQKKGINSFFIIDRNKIAIEQLKKKNLSFIELKNDTSFSSEKKIILKYMNDMNCEIIILDMRENGEKLSKILYKNSLKIILLDDAWCKNVYADILFNGTNVKSYQQYNKKNIDSKLFLGTKYWILPDEFKNYKKQLSDIYNKNQYNILISMGGSDPSNLTSKIIKSIIKISQIKVKIIFGPFSKNHSEILNLVKNKKNIKIIYSSKNIWKEFFWSDVTISGGGNTLFELASLGIPTLCIPTFKHEILYVNEFMKKKYSYNLGFKQKNSLKINYEVERLLKNEKIRKEMCRSGKKLLDGKGLSRVVNIIVSNIKNF